MLVSIETTATRGDYIITIIMSLRDTSVGFITVVNKMMVFYEWGEIGRLFDYVLH